MDFMGQTVGNALTDTYLLENINNTVNPNYIEKYEVLVYEKSVVDTESPIDVKNNNLLKTDAGWLIYKDVDAVNGKLFAKFTISSEYLRTSSLVTNEVYYTANLLNDDAVRIGLVSARTNVPDGDYYFYIRSIKKYGVVGPLSDGKQVRIVQFIPAKPAITKPTADKYVANSLDVKWNLVEAGNGAALLGADQDPLNTKYTSSASNDYIAKYDLLVYAIAESPMDTVTGQLKTNPTWLEYSNSGTGAGKLFAKFTINSSNMIINDAAKYFSANLLAGDNPTPQTVVNAGNYYFYVRSVTDDGVTSKLSAPVNVEIINAVALKPTLIKPAGPVVEGSVIRNPVPLKWDSSGNAGITGLENPLNSVYTTSGTRFYIPEYQVLVYPKSAIEDASGNPTSPTNAQLNSDPLWTQSYRTTGGKLLTSYSITQGQLSAYNGAMVTPDTDELYYADIAFPYYFAKNQPVNNVNVDKLYFYVRTKDAAGNFGPISNNTVLTNLTGLTPPAPTLPTPVLTAPIAASSTSAFINVNWNLGGAQGDVFTDTNRYNAPKYEIYVYTTALPSGATAPSGAEFKKFTVSANNLITDGVKLYVADLLGSATTLAAGNYYFYVRSFNDGVTPTVYGNLSNAGLVNIPNPITLPMAPELLDPDSTNVDQSSLVVYSIDINDGYGIDADVTAANQFFVGDYSRINNVYGNSIIFRDGYTNKGIIPLKWLVWDYNGGFATDDAQALTWVNNYTSYEVVISSTNQSLISVSGGNAEPVGVVGTDYNRYYYNSSSFTVGGPFATVDVLAQTPATGKMWYVWVRALDNAAKGEWSARKTVKTTRSAISSPAMSVRTADWRE